MPTDAIIGIYKQLEKSTDFCLQTHISISRVAQGLDEVAELTVGDERHIVERWDAVQKELGNDTHEKHIHHHPFKFKHTDHMSVHDVKRLLEERGMRKASAGGDEDREHDEKVHHQIIHKLRLHRAGKPIAVAE